MYRKLTLTIIAIGIAGLLASVLAFAQFDYYDPYSNSNIDYFPTNPINVSPSRTDRTTGNTNSGSKTEGATSTDKTNIITPCANRPIPGPQTTRSVEIRDKSGKVFYLSPPKEELTDVISYPNSDSKIYQNTKEIGVITVDNNCYPKYGYIENPALKDAGTKADVPDFSVQDSRVPDSGVPANRTAARLDPLTGKVYNAKTGALIEDARYDAAARAIYYRDTNSSFGKVLTDTEGYVNIEIISAPPPESLSPIKAAPESKYKKSGKKKKMKIKKKSRRSNKPFAY
jgi:hypothetical protein